MQLVLEGFNTTSLPPPPPHTHTGNLRAWETPSFRLWTLAETPHLTLPRELAAFLERETGKQSMS